MPYFLPASSLFLSAIFPETTSLPFRCYSVTTVLPSNTFPVPSYLSSAQLPNILHLQCSNLPTTGAQRQSTAKRTTTCHPPPVKCSALIRRANILLLPRLVVEYSIFSLSISPESYSGISVIVLPLSVHAEYLCVPLSSLMLDAISPSKKSQENTIFLAHLQIFMYLCPRILRWREICPAKSVSQWFFLG